MNATALQECLEYFNDRCHLDPPSGRPAWTGSNTLGIN